MRRLSSLARYIGAVWPCLFGTHWAANRLPSTVACLLGGVQMVVTVTYASILDCSRLVHHVTILTRQKKAVANTPNITTTLISTPKPRSEREVGLSTVRYIGILCNRTPFAVRGGDFAFRISYGDDYVQKVEWVWVVGFSD
jgi:hypothetical protein